MCIGYTTYESELEPRNFQTRSLVYLSAMLGVGRLVEMAFIATYFAVKRRPERRRRKLLPEINVTDIPVYWHGYLQNVLRGSYCVTMNTS